MELEKNKNFNFLLLVCTLVFLVLPFYFCAFAEEPEGAVALSQKLIESKPSDDLSPLFNELTGLYYKNNRYDDCADFLKSQILKKSDLEPVVDYYIALTRFSQLKYLEDSQGWDEYFSKGNSYREELESLAQKADASLGQENPVKLYARLLLWRFHNDQQDTSREKSLADLMSGVSDFSQKSAQGKDILKEVADRLLAGGQKQEARQVYRRCVDLLTKTETNVANLKAAALKFYQDGNVTISEEVYDAYIQRRLKTAAKEELLPELVEIAKLFCAGESGQKNAAFAEEVFKKIEELGGKDGFDEQLSFLRAYNLEKAKDFLKAKDASKFLKEKKAFSSFLGKHLF
ncbi:MAG: hypothetical protein NT033_07265 [Candidatus Omnitrophica bacterium]|nr:hypothetical protein [Candidatus Omnitrophota bacterium]